MDASVGVGLMETFEGDSYYMVMLWIPTEFLDHDTTIEIEPRSKTGSYSTKALIQACPPDQLLPR